MTTSPPAGTPTIPPWLVTAIAERLRNGTPLDHERASTLLTALETAKKRNLHIIPPQNFVDSDPVRWIETHFRIPETADHRLHLAPYQRLALTEALSRDPSGNFKYSNVIWSDIKKSAKSTLAAAVALWMGFQNPWGQVILVANDLKQADSRVGFYLRRSIELNPDLAATCKTSATSYRVTLPNHTIIEAVPIDPTGEAGSNADFIVFSELWGAHQDAQSRMWCYDQETDLLTKRGWISGTSLTTGDEIATFNPTTQVMEWEIIDNFYRAPYQGPMHLYENRRFSVCVTPDHRLYGKFSYNTKNNPYCQTGVMISSELRSSGFGVYFPRTSIAGYPEIAAPDNILVHETKFKPAYSIPADDWFFYLGWYTAEGRVKHNTATPASVYVSQSPEANQMKWNALYSLHDKIFSVPGWRLSSSRTDFIVDSSALGELVESWIGNGTGNKSVCRAIKDAPFSLLKSFLEGFLAGDGHQTSSGSWQISIGNQQLANDILEIGFKLGWVVSIAPKTPKNPKWHTYWRVRLSPSNDGYDHEVSKRHGHWKTIDYNGIVWCPSTRNGLIIVRRHGKVHISGNTEMTLSPTKFGRSLRWVETYAGYTGESVLLERLWTEYVKPFYTEAGSHPSFAWARSATPPIPIFASSSARTLVLWNDYPRLPWQSREYYCLPLPDDPERFLVMTDIGMKPAANITPDDRIAVRSLDGKVTYDFPKAIHRFDYTGNLYSYSNIKAEFSVTEGHRLLAKVKSHTRKLYGDYKLIPVEQAIRNQAGSIPTTGGTDAPGIPEFIIEDEHYLGDDFIELLAWYISEGSINCRIHGTRSYPGGVMIAQDQKANPDKHHRIGELLNRLGLASHSKSKSWGWAIYNSRLARYFHQFGKSSDKFIPDILKTQASQSQLRRFIEVYVLGDGTRRSGGVMLYTNSDQLKADLSLLAWKAGYRVADHGSWAANGNLPIHHLYLSETDLGWSTTTKSRNPWSIRQVENLPVWCPETSQGTFYAIVDGFGFWTGNSQEEGVLLPGEFLRIHRNQWVSSQESFVPAEWWDACRVDSLPSLTRNDSLIVCADAGVSSDSFAVVGVSRLEIPLPPDADPLTYEDNSLYQVRYVGVWYPPPGGKIDFSEPEAELRRLFREYNVVEFCYDPYQLEDMAGRFRNEAIVHTYAFTQGQERLIADKSLYDSIRSRRIVHTGEPDLREHILNANAEKGKDSKSLRLVKKSESRKIDAAVALSMARDRAAYWKI